MDIQPPPREGFRAIVKGRVQGVGFRYSARREALRLDLKGWVRNVSDGSVEILAEGDSSSLASFIEWLKEGPDGAYVENILVDRRLATGAFKSFIVEF